MSTKTKVQALYDEIGRLNDEVKSIFDTADATGGEELDSVAIQKVKDNNRRIEEIEGQIKGLAEQEALRQQAVARRLPTPQREAVQEQAEVLGAFDGRKAGRPAARKSWGEQVLADPEFKTWLSKMAPGGIVTRGQFGRSPGVEARFGAKTLLTSGATSGGALVDNQFLGLLDMGTFMRPLTIRDIITIGTTDSDVVEYVRVTGFTNSAAPVAEASATSGSTGAKPESAMAMEVVTETVKAIAHWIPATRRVLADAGQLRTYVDTFLQYGLAEELEDQILAGSGSGQNFTGVLNTTGTTAQAYDTNLLTTTRKARTAVRITGRAQATAYVMHPNDWEDLDLLQDNEARYYFGGPSVLGTPRLWGLPVVESEGMTEGYAVCADWRLATLWDRETTQVYVSDSHSDFFIRNMIAILAELRAAFTLLRPAAFVEADLTA